MSFGDDFAAVDTAGAPLDPVIMIGADPMFWGAVLLAVLVAALVGWWFGAGSRDRHADAAGSIWEAVDHAAKAAMKADTESLPAHGAHLQRVLHARLGKTLKFGGELSACVHALDCALKGEAAQRGGHGADDHPAGETAATTEREAASSSSAAANVTIVSIHPTAPAHASASSPGRARAPLGVAERDAALRLAVAGFNDYWRHRPAREADMRAVVAELCTAGPSRPAHGRGGDHH